MPNDLAKRVVEEGALPELKDVAEVLFKRIQDVYGVAPFVLLHKESIWFDAVKPIREPNMNWLATFVSSSRFIFSATKRFPRFPLDFFTNCGVGATANEARFDLLVRTMPYLGLDHGDENNAG